ncbi:D-alanyl-D-alanine carboxypeptidase [Streptomyces olivoreticuli]|uniref:D-alanyl-D-alanine carboxypeptidase n=1 Tax=Streptomyces olivoreticuli TaxID=68246 RepID=UPI002658E403|nr:D-alanyl-D-alanine carboxypeptidase [Streptomyces olivoreticuli]WKK24277.1 D-alanyl-D-alanine carboxypeptidase [Streptomyces olivoreticuli]
MPDEQAGACDTEAGDPAGTEAGAAGQDAADDTAIAGAEESPATTAPHGADPSGEEEDKAAAESDPNDDTEDDNDGERAGSAITDHGSEPAPEKPGRPSRPGAAHEQKTVVAEPVQRPGGVAAAEPSPQPEAGQPPPPTPLDLLAQLTNTPPPPETPARTIVRRLKIWTPIALALAAVLMAVQAVRPLPDATLELAGSTSSYTFDGRFDIPWPEKGQGAVQAQGMGGLGTFGERKPVPIASVAKVMTAYVLLKEHPLKKDEAGPEIEVDDKAVQDGMSEDESRVEGLTVGTKFSQQDMLKMLMIPSGNNIARLLARWDTGSDTETAFVRKMNDAAKALGMKDTTYTDPSGLDAETVSTAVDQLRLAEAVMTFDAFRPIVALPNATIEGLPQPIINNNDSLLLAGLSITGIKTGSNTAAGGALMWAAYKTVGDETPLLLGTLLDQRVDGPDLNGANSLALVKDNSKKVIEAVRSALTSSVAVDKGQVVGHLDDGLGGRTPLVAAEDLKVLGVPGHKLDLRLDDAGKSLPRTAKAGTEVGVLTAGSGPDVLKVPVALQADLVEPSLGSKLTRLG